jgi:hypothetical protein
MPNSIRDGDPTPTMMRKNTGDTRHTEATQNLDENSLTRHNSEADIMEGNMDNKIIIMITNFLCLS